MRQLTLEATWLAFDALLSVADHAPRLGPE